MNSWTDELINKHKWVNKQKNKLMIEQQTSTMANEDEATFSPALVIVFTSAWKRWSLTTLWNVLLKLLTARPPGTTTGATFRGGPTPSPAVPWLPVESRLLCHCSNRCSRLDKAESLVAQSLSCEQIPSRPSVVCHHMSQMSHNVCWDVD